MDLHYSLAWQTESLTLSLGTAFQVVADNLPEEQVDEIKEMFYTMDTDKTGDLTFEELKYGLHKYGQHVADPEVQMLMDAVNFSINPLLLHFSLPPTVFISFFLQIQHIL